MNLNIVGIKYNPKGYKRDKAKLIAESLNKCFCVFIYTPQKQDT